MVTGAALGSARTKRILPHVRVFRPCRVGLAFHGEQPAVAAPNRRRIGRTSAWQVAGIWLSGTQARLQKGGLVEIA